MATALSSNHPALRPQHRNAAACARGPSPSVVRTLAFEGRRLLGRRASALERPDDVHAPAPAHWVARGTFRAGADRSAEQSITALPLAQGACACCLENPSRPHPCLSHVRLSELISSGETRAQEI